MLPSAMPTMSATRNTPMVVRVAPAVPALPFFGAAGRTGICQTAAACTGIR